MPYFEESYAWDKASLYFYSHQESCLGLESNPWSSVATCHWPSCVWLVQPRRIVSQLNFLSNLEKKNGWKKLWGRSKLPSLTVQSNLAVRGIFWIQLFPNWTACSPVTYTNFVLADCRIISGQDKKKKMFTLFWFWPQPIATHETDIQICLCPGLYLTFFSIYLHLWAGLIKTTEWLS